MEESVKTLAGTAVVGSKIAWSRHGRYHCLIIGVVESFTPAKKMRITVVDSTNPHTAPRGERLVAEPRNSVVLQ